MELKQIKELMTAMGRTGTKKLVLKKGGFELQLERHDNSRTIESDLPDETMFRTEIQRPSSAPLPRTESHPMLGNEPKQELPGTYITSPMVGTFYSSPSPDEPYFVKAGDTVDKNTVVCIVEAMKVMNEIKAGVSGVVAEVLVENGHPVEFGTKLFRINS